MNTMSKRYFGNWEKLVIIAKAVTLSSSKEHSHYTFDKNKSNCFIGKYSFDTGHISALQDSIIIYNVKFNS